MIPKRITKGYIVLRYKKPINLKGRRMRWKWEVVYIPKKEIEALIRQIVFKKKFYQEIMNIVLNELRK